MMRKDLMAQKVTCTHLLLMALLGIISSGLLTFAVTETAHATDFRGGDIIIVDADEVINDDLFISGETVTINGTVKGNLFATGTTVTVNGPVEGSLFIAGRTLALNSPVAGSVYVGGYTFTVGEAAQIGRNLNFGGFSLGTARGSEIGRSLYGGGYQFLLNGSVTDDVNVGGGALELNGHVGGSVYGSVGSAEDPAPTTYMPAFEGSIPAVAPGLRVSDAAEVGGTLSVTVDTPTAATIAQPPIYSLANSQLRWAIGEVIALLVIGLLFLYIRPTLLKNAGAAVQSQPFLSLGIGFLTLLVAVVAVPIVIALLVLLAVWGGWFTLGQLVGDIIGLGIVSLLFGVGLFVFTAGMLTKIIVAYGGSHLLIRRLVGDNEMQGPMTFLTLAFGVIIYVALRVLPFGIGWTWGFLVTLIGLGAIYLALRGRATPTVAAERYTLRPMEEAHAA